MKIAFNPSTVEALIAPPNNKDITFDLRGHNIFARGVKFCGTDTWRDIKINNVSIDSNTLDLRDGDNTTLTNINGIVTINSTLRPVVDNLTSDSTTSSLSANLGRVLAGLINGKSDSEHTHDDRYLRLTGGWMSGDINFGDDNKIYWGRNTDSASISFKNDGDGDADSYMSFVTSDNGNEYFRWSHSSGSTNTEWMALRSDGLRVGGTKVSLEGHNHDDRYVKKTGDTMLGALNFANGTWNLVGDDSYMGDCNVSGHFGIKAANTTYPGISFFNNANAHLGNLTAYNGNIKYGAYSLQFLDNGNTSVSASTWTNPFSDYNSNAVADGQAICVWGQSSSLSNLATDTGDMSLWLKRVNANVATLNMVLDGEYYANGNLRLAHVSEIPNSLKNPYSLTTFGVVYNGSAAKTVTTSTFISLVTEGTSTITDGTMFITSWASNSGFADTNAVNVPYKRKAIHLWEYVKAKTDSLYAVIGHNHDDCYLKLTGGVLKGQIILPDIDVNTSYTGSIIIGASNTENLGIDGNEIMARNNGKASTLYLNNEGGVVQLGAVLRTNSNIAYIGSQSTQNMIKFINNTSDPYGNGIAIGGGGLTIIGSGESSDVVIGLHSSGGDENMIIAGDGNIDFYSNLQDGWLYGKHMYLDTNGFLFTPSYINIGGNENNNSSPDRVWGSNSSDSYLRSYRTSALRVAYANSADSATKVIVTLHISNDTNYPLVWSNLANSSTVTENQLFKSWADLYYNPKNKRLYANNLLTGVLLTTDNHYYRFNSDATLRIYGSPGGNTERIYFLAGIDNRIDDYDIPSYGGEYRHSIILNPRGGFVGIGDTNPSYKLSVGGDIGTGGNIYISHSTNNNMNYDTSNPRIVFSENGSLAVGLVYTDYDSYRYSKGLKVMDVNNDDTGNVWLEVLGYNYSSGYVKNGSSDSYVLLGGGGHKAISDFASSSHSHNYAANENYGGFTKSGRLPISGFYQSYESESGGNAPWSSWMHLINCLHSNTNNNYALLIAASFYDNNTFKIRVTNDNVNNDWRNIIHSGNIGSQTVANAYHLRINSANTWSTWYWSGLGGLPSWLWGSNDGTNMYVWNPSNFNVNTALYLRSLGNLNCQTGRTLNYGDVYSYNTRESNTGAPTSYTSVIGFGRGTAGTVEIAGGWCNTYLYWRSLRDCCEDWFPWRTVLDSSNYTEFINNYYWANVKISASANTQTQPSVNTIYANNWFRSQGDSGWYNESYGGGIWMNDSNWIKTYGGKSFYCDNLIYSSSTIRTDARNQAIVLSNNSSPAWISGLDGQVIFNTSKAIRFGETAWDWNQWAGLKYTHSNKTIYLGIADGSIFNSNGTLSGGTLNLRAGISNIDLNSGTSIRGLPTDGSPYSSSITLRNASIYLSAYGDISMSTGPGAIELTSGYSGIKLSCLGNNASIDSGGFKVEASRGAYLNSGNSGNVYLCSGGGNVSIGYSSPSYKLDVNGLVRADGFHHWSVDSNNYVLLAGGGYKSFGGNYDNPIFLGYLNLDHGNDGTISSSFYCLGYSVSFTYTRGGNYCKIYIPDTSYQTFYIRAAIASVNYSGGGMDTWVGDRRGDGAWWLHCYASGSNEVRVKGFCLRNSNNDSWWGGNPLWSGSSGANRITVCIFGYVTFK